MEQAPEYIPSSPENVEETLQRICAELSQGQAEQITPVEFSYDGQEEGVRFFRIYRGNEPDTQSSLSDIIIPLLDQLNETGREQYAVTLDTRKRGNEGSENIIRIEKLPPEVITE